MNISNCSRNGLAATLAAALGVVVLSAGCGRPPELGPVANLAVAAKIRTALAGDSAGGEESAAATTGTGWGTLKGKFTFVGDPPKLPPYQVNKDPEVCAPGGNAPLQEFLKVDSGSGGIANIVLIVRKVTRVHESAEPQGGDVVFDQKECLFLTHVAGVKVGQTLQIKNSDSVGHNTNISGQNSFNQTIPNGATVPLEIKKEEAAPQPVRCSIHPWMLAYLLPRSNAYFAITKPDGTFEIANLPAGEKLEIQVWHEAAAGPNQALVIESPETKELKWSNKGRFVVTLGEDETKELNLSAPASAFKGI